MNTSFTFFMPTRILFGQGTLKALSTIPALPGKKALVVIGAGGSMRRLGYLDRVVNGLRENGVESVVFDQILPNPVVQHVTEGATLAKASGCDFVVGLGGGSAIDSAKSIALMAKNPGDYWDYIQTGSGKGRTPEEGALPIVAIPTTAGTGSETDPWTVITKPDTHEKIGFGADFTFPTLAVVDPELMVSVPPELTAYQGMDAFCHAAEGYLATVAQPASDFFALEAIRLITRFLPLAVKDGTNLNARTALAWASTAAGIVESLSSCLSHHSLEHAISAYHPEVPHGAGLIMTSVAYFTYLAQRNPDRFEDMAQAMGKETSPLTGPEKPLAFVTALKKLIRDIGMEDLKPATFGIKREEAWTLARNSFDTMGMLYAVTPVQLEEEDVARIFENTFR